MKDFSFHQFRRALWQITAIMIMALFISHCGDKKNTTEPIQTPTISITSPSNGDTLSGSVQIMTTTTNTDMVYFYCDGTGIGSDNTSPYSLSWNSASVSDGVHSLKAKAEGGGGSAEAQIQVVIKNNQPGIVVTVIPATATVQVGQTQQFTAQVTGTANTSVTWVVVEGNAWGTISTTGLYTAPAVLPSPATATVRATSVADPTKSATARVTITGGGGVPQEIIALCQQTFNAGYAAGNLGDESVSLAAEAVWGASELNGWNLTLTGTLTQTAQGSDVWTYSANPSNKLVIVFAGGPTIEITFTHFEGYLNGTWEDFTEQHILDFTIFIQGQTNLRIQSQSRFVTGSPFPKGSPHIPEWNREWQQVITGTTLYEGQMLTVNITHHGAENGFTEPGWTYLAHDETFTGTASSATIQMNISQTSYISRMHNSNTATHVLNGQFTNNSSSTMNGITYQYNNAHAAWAAGSSLNDPGAFNIVIDTNYWAAQGNMTKNGQLFGTVQFSGPVIQNAYGGPDLYLHLTTGEDIFLHTLVQWP